MRYTRKNIAELMKTVEGGPDVKGHATSTIGWNTYVLVASAGGAYWQDVYSPGNRLCEDGTGPVTVTEDAHNTVCPYYS